MEKKGDVPIVVEYSILGNSCDFRLSCRIIYLQIIEWQKVPCEGHAVLFAFGKAYKMSYSNFL
jgi:hypothetical protein